jgi:riboflavin synthase
MPVMFTGIIEGTLRITAVVDGPRFRRLTLNNPWTDVKHGESIAVNGCCLTVAEIEHGQMGFDVIAETLDKTNLGALQSGDAVNAERSLRVGDRIDGHFVQGHIDGVARLLEVSTNSDEWRMTIESPPHLAKYLIPKGSIAIDGVSLTLAAVDGNRFQVALIPTTLKLTTLEQKQPGWLFNLEADVFSKTIVSYLERMKI